MLRAINFTLLALVCFLLDLAFVVGCLYAIATAAMLLILGYPPLYYPLLNLVIAVGCAAGAYVMLRISRIFALIGYEASKP